MAINGARSMNQDLYQGQNDGLTKSLAPDRGGVVEYTNVLERANKLQAQYSITGFGKAYGQSCNCGYC